MMKRLTSVPTVRAPIIAMARGFCSSEPRSLLNNTGSKAKTDVSEVITMERRRRVPASWIASLSGVPCLRSSLMTLTLRMESLTMMPQVTMRPMADMILRVCPHVCRQSRPAAMSIGISKSRMSGCTNDSN